MVGGVSDNGPVIDSEQRPVLSGLVALVAVALAVGLIAGLALVMGTKVLGIGGGGGDADPSAQPSGGETLYLPEPTPTETTSAVPVEPEPTVLPTETSEPVAEDEITLAVSSPTVAPMAQIDLTGTYLGGDGAILQVQRLEEGEWMDFPVTASVNGTTYATFVQTGRTGSNKFRMRDTDSDLTSNEVEVTIG